MARVLTASPGWKQPDEQWQNFFEPELKPGNDRENRELLIELTRKYGADWVWEHRRRLVELMRYLMSSGVAQAVRARS